MTTEAARAIEAILMVAQEPIDPHLLAQLLEVAPARVEELCRELQAAYEAEQRGFVLARVAGGYRFQSHGDLAPYVERFVLEGQSARLSAAALETLAIVAYKQPLSRAQVASIRGVNVDGVMRTLQQRGYVEEVGKDPGPGQATLFGTSTEFLERMGLDRIEDLPPIAALFPSTEVMEALERGLRADPVPAPDELPLGDPSDTPAPVAASEVEPETEAETEGGPALVEPAEPTPDWSEAPVAITDDLDDLDAPVTPLEEPSWARRPEDGSPAPDAAVDVDGDGTPDLPPAP